MKDIDDEKLIVHTVHGTYRVIHAPEQMAAIGPQDLLDNKYVKIGSGVFRSEDILSFVVEIDDD